MDVQVTEVSMDVGSDGKLALVKVGEEPTAKKTKRSHKGKKKEKKEKEKDKEKDKEKGKEKKHKKHKDSKKKHKGGKKKHKDQEPESGTDHTQKRRDLSTQAASMFAPGTPEYYAEDPSRRERAEALFKETEADMQDKSGIVNVRRMSGPDTCIHAFISHVQWSTPKETRSRNLLWALVSTPRCLICAAAFCGT